jgi:hypothetical protein
MNVLKTVTQPQEVQSAQRRYPSRHTKCSVLKTHKELRIQSKRECESSTHTHTHTHTHIHTYYYIHTYILYILHIYVYLYVYPPTGSLCVWKHRRYRQHMSSYALSYRRKRKCVPENAFGIQQTLSHAICECAECIPVCIACVFPGWRRELDSVHIQNGDACQKMPFPLNTQVFE